MADSADELPEALKAIASIEFEYRDGEGADFYPWDCFNLDPPIR